MRNQFGKKKRNTKLMKQSNNEKPRNRDIKKPLFSPAQTPSKQAAAAQTFRLHFFIAAQPKQN